MAGLRASGGGRGAPVERTARGSPDRGRARPPAASNGATRLAHSSARLTVAGAPLRERTVLGVVCGRRLADARTGGLASRPGTTDRHQEAR